MRTDYYTRNRIVAKKTKGLTPLGTKYFFLLFTTLCFYSGFSQGNLELVNKGKSNYIIVVPLNANDMEGKAAKILQEYIFRISQCTLPIIEQEKASGSFQIIIGRTKKVTTAEIKDLADDGILIKGIDNSIVLTGGSRKGVLYSIYTFLEDYLGCQAFSYKDIVVPTKTTIVLPGGIYKREVPTFTYRMGYFTDAYAYEYCDWRKLNYITEDWGIWVHSFRLLLPESEYFSSHPEYFALINGKRNPVQPDLSNPDVLRIVIAKLETLVAGHKEAKYWSVSQNDGTEYCQCPKCSKLDAEQESHQGSILTFVNEVAKHFSTRIISTLAYGYSEKPPKSLKPAKNVMIMLTTGTVNDRRIPVKDQPIAFNQNFKKWSSISTHLFLWDYVVNYEHAMLPFPNLQALQPNVRYFALGKAKYIQLQGLGDVASEFSELRCYLATKLMWNKDINVSSATNTFLNHYYGKQAAVYIRQYMELLTTNTRKSKVALQSNGSIEAALSSYLSIENLNTYKSLFNKALSMQTAGSIYEKRISKEYSGLLYAELENKRLSLTKQAEKPGLVKKADNPDKKEQLKVLDDWYQKAKAGNMMYTNEARLSLADYYASYLKLINTQ